MYSRLLHFLTSRGGLRAARAAWFIAAIALFLYGSASMAQTCPCSIWNASAAPTVVDAGPDSPVELGLKFEASTDGYITGVRFYKSAANTGTHVGNLWSSTGALLGTAVFTNETASGWQQVNFTNPVPVTANTLYVVSYHSTVGHWSATFDGFNTSGVNNPPLTALSSSSSGGNGVYTYGSTSLFPTSSYIATNYWVDVVYSQLPITSIAVTPANATISVGGTQQYTGTATYSDNSTADITSQATWTSSNTLVASMGSMSLATGLAQGSTTITATLGSVSGNTGLTVQPPPAPTCPCFIWSATTTPATVDAGPDNPVELGVKFRADSNGYITSVRFYKSASNTGTHVGNLWSLSGTLLATATFTNETASGWQQVNFSSPVAITANTVYVASYHTNVGHWSVNWQNFFNAGVDNPPLHAQADGVSGGDGVYMYGATSSFPTNTFESANYWVDVAYTESVSTATLTSIAVTPANTSIGSTGTQQFTATGTYSDSSTQNITMQVAWASSKTNFATINGSGLAAAVAAGTTVISATLSGITGSTNLTVNPPATLQSIAVTPANQTITAGNTLQFTATGTYSDSSTQNLTSQVTWASSIKGYATIATGGLATGQSAGATTISATLSGITGSTTLNVQAAPPPPPNGCPCSIWTLTTVPATIDNGPDNSVELGVKFTADDNGYITGIRFYKSAANTGTHVGNLWSSSGTLLGSATFVNETASGWQQVNFSSPVAITAGTTYVASYHTTVGHWSSTGEAFLSAGVDNPPLHALESSTSGGDGVYAYGNTSSFPANSYNETNYWVDVVYTETIPPALTGISVSPTNPTLNMLTQQQFSATGQYADGSSQDITSQVNWTTSNSVVASISGTGLGVPLESGTTTISATQGAFTGSTTLSVTCGCTIENTATAPTGPCPPGLPYMQSCIDFGPDNPVELGVRFYSDVSGYISAIRFWKASTNTGTHVGNLWTNTGTLLASATFTNETASGWQQVNFSTPVFIAADTYYVASYFTSVGHYAFYRNAFATSGIDTPPLHALEDGVGGPDGPFTYAPSSEFPTSSYRSTYYYVDVVFTPSN
jgi:hypothetical protein